VTDEDAQRRNSSRDSAVLREREDGTNQRADAMPPTDARTDAHAPETQAPCDYYASPDGMGPDGTGDGLSDSTPFPIQKFWPLATPGKTLCLLDGTYGSLRVPSTLTGTADQPITIRALNDSKVLFDGGTSRPVDLRGNYGVLEGVNIHGGDNS